MRKFRSLETGAILVPKNEMVIEQLEKSEFYEEIGTKESKNSGKKDIKDFTKKELVALLISKGIQANEDMKKDDLLALVPAIEE